MFESRKIELLKIEGFIFLRWEVSTSVASFEFLRSKVVIFQNQV
jgi:hypothetical protein